MQSPSFQPPPKISSQPEGEHIKEDKGKKVLSLKEAEKESTKSGSNDETTHMHGSMVESSKKKELKKFDFVTEVESIRAASRITNCDVLTRKGPITLKVHREDGTNEIIPNFKASDLHLGEWREVMEACPKRTGKGWEIIYKQIGTRMDYIHTTEAELGINLDIPLSKQDLLDKLNDLANKKRKHADDIHDYFKANKRLKLHQGPGLDDHARTFSSLLLAEIDKRNLNPLKQMRVIEQLRQ
ncbi:hypothetical protein Tco_1406542 [Tanacetum coccineum]